MLRRRVPQGAVCWVDLWTSDVESSRNFYCELFDWEAQAASQEFGGYWMFTRDGLPGAGAMGDMGELTANDSWKIFIATTNIRNVVAVGESRGATVFVPPTAVSDLGLQAVLADPTGAAFGVWQPVNFPGFMTLNEHGTPCWFELDTRDIEGAVDFYASLFALDTHVVAASDAWCYTNLLAEGDEVAGVVNSTQRHGEGAGAQWYVY